jgi:hypothetical protein
MQTLASTGNCIRCCAVGCNVVLVNPAIGIREVDIDIRSSQHAISVSNGSLGHQVADDARGCIDLPDN